MSDDWSTSVGRGGCLEPDNVVPPLGAYDTSWHGIEGSGAECFVRGQSLPSSAGGYSVQESVSNLLVSGVCVQGHKVISGSRYRVAEITFDAYAFALKEMFTGKIVSISNVKGIRAEKK